MHFIKPFSKLGTKDTLIAGGKGASLCAMLAAGIPVPDGFVILTNAFDTFLKDNKLENPIADIVQKTGEDFDNASGQIQKLILNALLSKELEKEIFEAFNGLDTEFVAVRSSATAEDGSEASWAGQLESFLNTDKRNLLRNIQRCWASLFTPRALSYRRFQKLKGDNISVAVVVQKMIQADVSGIAFSVHPISENPDHILMNVGYGLGEAIVSGSVTPDEFTVSKKESQIVDRWISVQKRALVKNEVKHEAESAASGETAANKWVDIPVEKANVQKDSDALILEISKIVEQIEKFYNFPVDVEFAVKDGVVFIVQSRPITTLKCSWEKEEGENKNEKFDPSLWSSSLWKNAVFWKIAGYPFFVSAVIPTSSFIDKYDAEWANTILNFENGFFLEYAQNELILAPGRQALRDILACDDTFYIYISEILNRADEAVKFLQARREKEHFVNIYNNVRPAISGLEKVFVGFDFVLNDFMYHLKEEDVQLYHTIHSYIEEERPSFMQDATQYLNRLVKKHPNDFDMVHKLFIENYGWFLNSYEGKFDITREFLLDFYKSHKNETTKGKPANLPPLPKKYELLVKTANKVLIIRDIRKKLLFLLCEIMEDWLNELCVEHALDKQNMLYSDINEISEAEQNGTLGEISQKYASHKRVLIYYKSSSDMYFQDIPHELFESVDALNREISPIIKGLGCSKGIYTGVCKVIMSARRDYEKFQKGDILVTTMTRPDFLPLMIKAGAFVTDTGGVCCHAAIVAREMGKPCIIDTRNATTILKDGDTVTVDADNGIVTKH